MSDPYELAPQPPPPPMEVLPVEPIGYSSQSMTGRPGLIGGIGVASIVLASLGIFCGGLTAVRTIASAMLSSSMSRAAVAVPPINPSPAAVPPNSQESLGDHGMALADRQIVLDGLNQVRPLSDQRRRLVDELLAEDGKDIVLLSGDSLTVQQVAANVSDSGRLLSSRGGDDGPEFFVVSTGKMEVADDHASFFATDGTPPVRVTADSLPEIGAPAAPSGLTERQIQSIVRRIKLIGGRMTPAQIQTLTQTLRNPGEQLVVPTTDGSNPAMEIRSAFALPDGSVMISTLHNNATSMITLGPSGLVNNSMTSNTNFSTLGGGGGGGGNPFTKISPAAPLLAGLAAVASLGLSIYLLICGIMVLRHSPRGARLHWIYVALKIPLQIFVGVSIWWFVSQFTSNVSALSAGTPQGAAVAGISFAAMFVGIGYAIVGCIYPIVLLFLLSSRTVREYYADTVREAHF